MKFFRREKQKTNQEKLKSVSAPKEEKKDFSAFGKKLHLERGEVRDWLRGDSAWKASEMPREKRILLEKKLFDTKRFGEMIGRRDAEKVYKDFRNSPRGSQEKYKVSESERFKIIRLLEKFLGK